MKIVGIGVGERNLAFYLFNLIFIFNSNTQKEFKRGWQEKKSKQAMGFNEG
jgi:hypothetical protein